LEKCKISMQDNKGKFRCAPEEKPAVKPFLADKLTKGRESFECGPAGRLGTSPCSLACEQANLYYNRFGGPRQRETRHKTAAGPGPVKPAGKRRGFAAPAARRAAGWGKSAAPACGDGPGGPCPFCPARRYVQPLTAGGSLPSARSSSVIPSK